jgi:hypothetical protein
MLKKFTLLFIGLLLLLGSVNAQQRSQIVGYNTSEEWLFGTATTYATTLIGGVGVDTLRAMMKLDGSHYYVLYFEVATAQVGATAANEPDSTGFDIRYGLNYNEDATVSNGSSTFNFFEIGSTVPKFVKTWVPADTSNGGKHWVSLTFPASVAVPAAGSAEIFLISTAENDSTKIRCKVIKQK